MNRYLVLVLLGVAGIVAAAAVVGAAGQPKAPPMIPPDALAPEPVPPPPAAKATPTSSAAAVPDAAEKSDSPAKAGPVGESVLLAKLKEVRLIEIKYLRSSDTAEFEKGRRMILGFTDDVYVGAMVSVLYGPNQRYKNVLMDALKELAAHGSKPAWAYIQEIAVGDATAANRRRAIDIIKAQSPAPPADRLMFHLAVDEVPALRDRAALALATIGDKRAAWLMVERLTTDELRAITAEVAAPTQMSADLSFQGASTPKFRHVTIQAAAGGTVVSQTIDLPTVDVFTVATPMFGPTYTAVVGTRLVKVQHPEMLSSLKILTGRDFGFDKTAWTKWMESADGAKLIPAWAPLKLVAD
jgi:hypothetical protein